MTLSWINDRIDLIMTGVLPRVLFDPSPQTTTRIFSPTELARLRSEFDVREFSFQDDPRLFDALLSDTFAIVGQPDMPRARLLEAKRLKAILNVEGNFFPNVDYEAASRQGVRVLGCGPAYSIAVAEMALGMALDIARGISREDRAFRRGEELYVSASTNDSILITNSKIGFIGFGNVGRSLCTLLRPLSGDIAVFDPWLPSSFVREFGLVPSSLEDVLRRSHFLFILAAVTSDNEQFIDDRHLAFIPEGSRVVLVSRAGVVDFDAFVRRAISGQYYAAVDVWPTEPADPSSPARQAENIVLSAHRAGGIPEAFLKIGEMVVDDLLLMKHSLAPVRMQLAAPETASRIRSRPVR